jgi:putative transposase
MMPQSLSNILLHLIFSTKNRHPFIDEVIEPELYAYVTSILASHGSYVYKIGGIADHVHIFCTLPRILSVSNLLEEIKKILLNGSRPKDKSILIFLGKKVLVHYL